MTLDVWQGMKTTAIIMAHQLMLNYIIGLLRVLILVHPKLRNINSHNATLSNIPKP